MKRRIIIFLAFFISITCQSQTSDKTDINLTESSPFSIQVSFDTLDFSIIGYLRKAVLFHDNFYVMFETDRQNTTRSFKKMIVFNKNGTFIEDVFIPEKIQDMPHYDLIVENNNLYIKESQFEKTNFVLGAYVTDFKLTQTRDLKFYQDETYDIYAVCNGEWGGTIFFQDRITKESFEASSTCPIVINIIDNEYYITNYMGHMIGFASVIKIAEPKKLEKSDLNFKKEQGSEYNKGVETLLDTMDFYISSSFVVDNELLHLYSDEKGTYVGKIENGKMKQIYKFDFNFYAHFNQHLENGKQLLTFYFMDNEKSGLLMIDGKKFQFYLQR